MKLIDRFSFLLTSSGFLPISSPHPKNRSAARHPAQNDWKTMKIEQTFLCLNCDEVFHEDFKQCPGCASTNIVPLAKFLPPLKFNRILIRTFPIQQATLNAALAKLACRSDVE